MKAAHRKPSAKDIKQLRALFAKASGYNRQGQFAEAARSYRLLLSKLPEPVAYYNYAAVLKKLQDFEGALLNYEKALALKPDYAEAHANIGSIHMEKGAYETALAHYNKAIACNPRLAEAYYNRGVVLQELRRHDEALADYDRTLALQPGYYLAHLNKSVILYELKRKAEAARNYEQILSLNPEQVDAKWNLGILKLSEGDFTAGWALSESRLTFQADPSAGRLARPYWRGRESLEGKTLFLKWEQGFGDTIQFCRYAKLTKAAGATVILSVQNSLTRLVKTLDDGITIIGEADIPDDYDYHAYLMSLPHAFATTVETIPRPTKYLSIDPAEIAAWKTRLGDERRLKAGIVWAGSHRPDITCVRRNDANRSLTLAQYAPPLALPGIAFYSLQKGPPAAQLAAPQARHAVHDFTADLHDFADTGALIENLDLVITVDTAVAHLAAALGKTVWVLIPWVSCWRWLENRTDSPWYATVRLFRQDERGNWAPVIEAVKQELQRLSEG